ncbi:MAG: hypothetical protein J3K34DRAFT_271048 [Monoraphidium minutum]|nr:MAG: hypothetical protein J3K34DRAFT_271048 [Monoraphidium minutum]
MLSAAEGARVRGARAPPALSPPRAPARRRAVPNGRRPAARPQRGGSQYQRMRASARVSEQPPRRRRSRRAQVAPQPLHASHPPPPRQSCHSRDGSAPPSILSPTCAGGGPPAPHPRHQRRCWGKAPPPPRLVPQIQTEAPGVRPPMRLAALDCAGTLNPSRPPLTSRQGRLGAPAAAAPSSLPPAARARLFARPFTPAPLSGGPGPRPSGPQPTRRPPF